MNPRLVLIGVLVIVLGVGALAFFMFQGSGETRNVGPDAAVRTTPRVAAPVVPNVTPKGAETRANGPPPPIRPKTIEESSGPARNVGLNGAVRNEMDVEVEGALCELYEDLSATAERTEEGELREKQLTNSNGFFMFDRNVLVSPDRFILKVRHPLYGMERKSIDVTKPGLRLMVVTVRPGTAVSGTVRTVSGRPIPSVTVTVYDASQGAADPNGSVEAQGATDATGAYVIANLAAGQKKIVASLDGYGTARAPEIGVEIGKPVENLDFVLNPGAAITGQVSAVDGSPVGGVWVVARPTGEFSDNTEAVQKSGKYAAPPKQPTMLNGIPVLEPAATPEPEEGAGESKVQPGKDSPGQRDSAALKPRLKPTVLLQPTSLAARTRQDGSYVILGTEFAAYMVTVIAPGFSKFPEQRVESPANGVNLTVPRIPGSEGEPPPPPSKK